MTSRERVQRCLTFQSPDRAPRELWALPAAGMFQAEEVAQVTARFPGDFGGAGGKYPASERARGEVGRQGTNVDEWGVEWTVAEDGVVGEVRNPLLADWSALATYQPPWELLDGADLSEVNATCAASELYIRSGQCARPFERMQFLRGSENLFMDLGYDLPELYTLRDMVHDYYLREMEMWAKTDVDALNFMDDWGTQHSLLISPAQWRAFYKPLYKDYCDLAHAHGKAIFFHSDGHIEAIYPDLVELGVDAVNSQLFCMDIEKLGREFKGKITFWGEIDRQWILPFGDVDQVREAVWRVRRALDDGTGGVIAECEWGKHNPMQNIWTVYEEWEKELA
jgi:hypothetical protein